MVWSSLILGYTAPPAGAAGLASARARGQRIPGLPLPRTLLLLLSIALLPRPTGQ